MTRTRIVSVFAATVAAAVLSTTATQAQTDQKQAKEDWKALSALCAKYQDEFQSESACKKKGAALGDEWQAWKKEFEPLVATFKSRYGERHMDVGAKFEGLEKPLGVRHEAWEVANVAYNLDLAREEKKFAEWALEWGKDAYRIATHFPADNREKVEKKLIRAEDAVRYFKLAKLWNPGGDYVEYLEQSQALVAQVKPEWKKTLGELKWPGHNADFTGPGKPDDLAAAALDYLRKNPTWSKPEYDDEHTPVAACVTAKTWEVYKKAPLTEQPTQYSLDVLVAFTGQNDPELVYVYKMVFYTREEAGVAKEPPFHFANSRQYACYRMLKANLPAR